MKLEKIISLANKASELRFLAMVRSLRDTGFDLPVWVIPYDDKKFDLPDNCIWWEIPELISFLNENKLYGMDRKFQCFLTTNYQFVDADIVFVKDPAEALAEIDGFITSCCHWNNPWHTYVPSTLKLYKYKSTTWQKGVFNAGQYACDVQLYNLDTLKEAILNPLNKEAVYTHDQMSINLFVFLSGIKITNITLPPYNVESSWAGDYEEEDYAHYWVDDKKKPYIIHWAGCKMDIGRPIDKLFTDRLNESEKLLWNEKLRAAAAGLKKPSILTRIKNRLKRIINKKNTH